MMYTDPQHILKYYIILIYGVKSILTRHSKGLMENKVICDYDDYIYMVCIGVYVIYTNSNLPIFHSTYTCIMIKTICTINCVDFI